MGKAVKLFYSYSHKDASKREDMAASLAMLSENGQISEWHDEEIIPGEEISAAIKKNMREADIICFLVSRNFLNSESCRKEWREAVEIEQSRDDCHLVPIILETCDWQNLGGMKKHRALPHDGCPIEDFTTKSKGWQEVTEGIRRVVKNLNDKMRPDEMFLKSLNQSDFLSTDREVVTLSDIFVFPIIRAQEDILDDDARIDSSERILENDEVLIIGDERSGKSALIKHLFLELANARKPVLYVDLRKVKSGKPKESTFEKMHAEQWKGSYEEWSSTAGRVILFDNLSDNERDLKHIFFAKEIYDKVIVAVSTDIHTAFLWDRLPSFKELKICSLTHHRQEQLIRRWRSLSSDESTDDEMIDQIEKNVNSVILSNRIVPRYPFYVLSILQAYEGFLPANFSMSAYGHCYYVLILGCLIKSGISKESSQIDPCFNFATRYAFFLHSRRDRSKGTDNSEELFDEFVEEYKTTYYIEESLIMKMQHDSYGLLKNYEFREPYIYYYFLGKYIAENADELRDVIEKRADNRHVTANSLALIFSLHHSSENSIIEELLVRNMCALDDEVPATLDRDETGALEQFIREIPEDILSSSSVKKERELSRNQRDAREENENREREENEQSVNNSFYRILKNNEVLGHILINKHGSLPKEKVIEIIDVICSSGLRTIKLALLEKDEINEIAHHIHEKYPDADIDKLKNFVRMFSFIVTVRLIVQTVRSLNSPSLTEALREVTSSNATPAYELIEYFARVDTLKSENIQSLQTQLSRLMRKHRKNSFIKKILSLRTQHYMNTHTLKASNRQSLSSLLGINYRPRSKDENVS